MCDRPIDPDIDEFDPFDDWEDDWDDDDREDDDRDGGYDDWENDEEDNWDDHDCYPYGDRDSLCYPEEFYPLEQGY